MIQDLTIMNVIRAADQPRRIIHAYAYEIRNDSYLYLFVFVLSRSSIRKRAVVAVVRNKKDLTKAYSKINGRTVLRHKYRSRGFSPCDMPVAINARAISPLSRELQERNDRVKIV